MNLLLYPYHPCSNYILGLTSCLSFQLLLLIVLTRLPHFLHISLYQQWCFLTFWTGSWRQNLLDHLLLLIFERFSCLFAGGRLIPVFFNFREVVLLRGRPHPLPIFEPHWPHCFNLNIPLDYLTFLFQWQFS